MTGSEKRVRHYVISIALFVSVEDVRANERARERELERDRQTDRQLHGSKDW